MKKLKVLFTLSALIIGLAAGAQAQAKSKSAKTVEQQVYSKLRGLPNYSVFDFIQARVNGDTVTLTGKTYSLGTKDDAASAVKHIPGISKVVNNIEQLPASPYDDKIRASLLRKMSNGGLGRYLEEYNPDVHIIVENGRVTFEGYVASNSDRNVMNMYANGVFGVFDVKNNVVVGRDSRRS